MNPRPKAYESSALPLSYSGLNAPLDEGAPNLLGKPSRFVNRFPDSPIRDINLQNAVRITMKELKSMKINDLKIYGSSTCPRLFGEVRNGFHRPFFLCFFMPFLNFMVNFPFF